MMLPEEFENRMRRLLGTEYPAFAESYDRPPYQALRLNPFKADRQAFLAQAAFSLHAVPWAEDGFYYGREDFPGRHPYHEAGLYYIQEPSAMAPAEYIEAKPGERILDLCAAPGGKSTQIAGKMKGEGILVCNEIHPARARILSENIERMGICNAIVTNESPERLSEYFPEYFDKILVDAPCSGEGMFRKNETALTEWSLEHVKACADRQDEILSCAAAMLRPGGRLVYSTCTFAPEENEGSISRFLKRFPDFALVPAEKKAGMTAGHPEWVTDAAEHIGDTIRLFPHKLQGEGHFLAVMQKKDDGRGRSNTKVGNVKRASKADCKAFAAFCEENFRKPVSEKPSVPVSFGMKKISEGIYLMFGDQLYLAPGDTPSLHGLKALHPGLHLGTNKKNRFEPSHALALFLDQNAVCRSYHFSGDREKARAYISGEAFPAEGEKGWYLITVDGYSIGWGKLSGGMMKNHYPKGLRRKL